MWTKEAHLTQSTTHEAFYVVILGKSNFTQVSGS